jgi:hypothetical protein
MRMREAAHVTAVGLAASARHRHQTNLAGHRQQDRVGASIARFDTEQPHKAFDTKCHAESRMASPRSYDGLHELTYLFLERDVTSPALAAACATGGSTPPPYWPAKHSPSGSRRRLWRASIMRSDLAYFNLEQKALRPVRHEVVTDAVAPRGYRRLRDGQVRNLRRGLSPMSQVRSVTYVSGLDKAPSWRRGRDSNPR